MLKIKSVMVTGASGKLGGPLCEALVAEGYHVLAADLRLPVGVDGVEEVNEVREPSRRLGRIVRRSE